MNPVLSRVPRKERRHLLAQEIKRRKSGEWGEWETKNFPRGTVGHGWASDFEVSHKNRVFSVLDRTLPDGTRHLGISSLSGIRPNWWEAQRIKNELAGEQATAVEVYPPMDEVVDAADMYHLWVLPTRLPFTLKRSQKVD